MSEARIPEPGAEDDWDNIDEAVRDQYGQLLTAGTNLLSDSEIMGRLDPLSLFSPLLRTGLSAASHPDKVAGALARAAGEMVRASTAATVRAVGGTSSYAPKHGKDTRTGGLQIRPGPRMPGTGGSERSTTTLNRRYSRSSRTPTRRPPSSRRRSSPCS